MTPLGGWRARAISGSDAAGQDEAALWADLARGVAQGDRAAESELATRFHARVLTMASVRLHGSDAAQDVAQETIVAVLEALRAGRLREPGRLPAFVLSTARNLINNHLRARARSREVPDDPPDVPARPDRGLAGLDAHRRSLVREALGRLKPLDRRILLLTLVEGMTPREIAPLVGLKPEAVRTHKARAARAIAGHIKRLTRRRLLNHIGMSGRGPWAR